MNELLPFVVNFIHWPHHSQDAWTQIYHGRSHSTFGSDQVCLAEFWDLIQIMWKKFGWTLLMIVIIASPHAHAKFFLCFCGCVCMMKSKETCAEKFCNEHNIFKSPNPHITLGANILYVLNTENRFKIEWFRELG